MPYKDARKHKAINEIAVRKYRLKKQYSMSENEHQTLLEKQGGLCAICHKPEIRRSGKTNKANHLSVDHDHSCCPGSKSCGRCVRALLCGSCNLMLGFCDDNPDRLRAAAAYIESHKVSLQEHTI